LEVLLWRYGFAMPMAGAMLVAAAALTLVRLLPAQERLAELRAEVVKLRVPPPPVPRVSTDDGAVAGDALRTMLARAAPAPVQMRQIASLASTHGIRLPKGQYASAAQVASSIEHTEVTLNFVAGYPQARSFIEDVLRGLPNASIDRVSFERDRALGTEAAVTARLTLWRLPADATPWR
jgi:hypothetical protein